MPAGSWKVYDDKICYSLQKALSYTAKNDCLPKTKTMSVVKVIELIASSEKGFDDAVQQAVTEASKTIRNVDSVWVKDMKVHVKDGKIKTYGVICKVSFRLDDEKTKKKEKKEKKQKKEKE